MLRAFQVLFFHSPSCHPCVHQSSFLCSDPALVLSPHCAVTSLNSALHPPTQGCVSERGRGCAQPRRATVLWGLRGSLTLPYSTECLLCWLVSLLNSALARQKNWRTPGVYLSLILYGLHHLVDLFKAVSARLTALVCLEQTEKTPGWAGM